MMMAQLERRPRGRTSSTLMGPGPHTDRLCMLRAHLVAGARRSSDASPPDVHVDVQDDVSQLLLDSVTELGRLRRASRTTLEDAQAQLAEVGAELVTLGRDAGQDERLQSSAQIVASELKDLLELDRRSAAAT